MLLAGGGFARYATSQNSGSGILADSAIWTGTLRRYTESRPSVWLARFPYVFPGRKDHPAGSLDIRNPLFRMHTAAIELDHLATSLTAGIQIFTDSGRWHRRG